MLELHWENLLPNSDCATRRSVSSSRILQMTNPFPTEKISRRSSVLSSEYRLTLATFVPNPIEFRRHQKESDLKVVLIFQLFTQGGILDKIFEKKNLGIHWL